MVKVLLQCSSKQKQGERGLKSVFKKKRARFKGFTIRLDVNKGQRARMR